MPKILLLNDNSEQDNWGAQATPYAIQRMLRDTIPGADTRWFSYSWLNKRFRRLRLPLGKKVVYEPDRVPRMFGRIANRVSRRAEFFPDIADEFEHFADEWMAGRGGPLADEFMAAATQSDVIVHNGENSMYKNSVMGCRALFMLWFAKTRLGKPSCEINQTVAVSSMPRPIMRGMVEVVYPLLDAVTVREPRSLADLASLEIADVQLVPDPVFYLSTDEDAERSFGEWKRRVNLDARPYFCLSAAALPMDRPRPGQESASAVVQLVRKLKRIIPQAVLMAKDSHCLFLEKVAQETGSIYFGPEHEFPELWHLLRGATFLVSGHYHYVIVGSMVGCPFIPFATNNHKMDGICEHLSWHRTRLYDPTALRYCMHSICVEAERLIGDREALSQQLLVRTAELKAEAKKNALLIKDLLTRDKKEPVGLS